MKYEDLEFKLRDFEHLFEYKNLRRQVLWMRKVCDRANTILKSRFEKASPSQRLFQNELARRMLELDEIMNKALQEKNEAR